MNILYFHQHFSTPKGSAGIRSYQMARALVQHGHKVTMVCGHYKGGGSGLDAPFRKGKREGVIDGIRVVEFDILYANTDSFVKRTFLFFLFACRSVALVFTEKYDIVFATSTPLTAGIPGIVARWIRGKKFVFEVRDLWPELPQAMGVITNPLVISLMSFLEWLTYHSAVRIIGLAPGIVSGIIRRGVPEKNVTFIPNGCDINLFSEKIELWRPKDVKHEDFLAVFTGTHGLANGLSAVLDAAKQLQQRHRDDIKIVLIGQGREKGTLKESALREGLDNVIFHDPVGKKYLAGLLASADLGLQILANVPAFYYGTSPNKFFDYLAAGLPVLCNYPGWVADMIHEEYCGLVVEPEDPIAFADALEYAADNCDTLLIMGKHASMLAGKSFDRNILADYFVQQLESV